MSWEIHAPTGTYRNHALSPKIRMEAIADLVVGRFLTPEPGYGRMKGEDVTITRIMQLPLANKVGELEKLPDGRPGIDTKPIPVDEWGYKIPLTSYETDLTHFTLQTPFRRALRDQMRRTMDKMSADALKTTPVKAVTTSSGVDFSTTGTAPSQATANLSVGAVNEIKDFARTDQKMPGYRGGQYWMILSTKAARGLKSDPEYKDWISPTDSGPFKTGVLGQIDGVSFVETNNIEAVSDSIGLNGVTGEWLFLGEDPGVMAVVEDPEIRIGAPLGDDLGRQRMMGWVGTLQAGVPWDKANHSRCIHGTSTTP